MIATADTTVSEACRLIAALPVPTERDRKVERLRSISIMPAADRKGGLWRSEQRLEGGCSVFREDDGNLHVMVSSDLGTDPLAAGSLARRLAAAGFAAPASWRSTVDMQILCGFAVPADDPLDDTVEAILAAVHAISGSVPVNGYELRRTETRRVSQYWQNN